MSENYDSYHSPRTELLYFMSSLKFCKLLNNVTQLSVTLMHEKVFTYITGGPCINDMYFMSRKNSCCANHCIKKFFQELEEVVLCEMSAVKFVLCWVKLFDTNWKTVYYSQHPEVENNMNFSLHIEYLVLFWSSFFTKNLIKTTLGESSQIRTPLAHLNYK